MLRRKLTEEYLDQVARFLADAIINNFDQFQQRIQNLKKELETYKVVEEPRRIIGFHHNGKKEVRDRKVNSLCL
jgi:hypothetical protein